MVLRPKSIQDAIVAVADLLNPAQIGWVLGGGAARLLRGIDRATKDVDLLVAKKDIVPVQLLFDHYTIRPFEYNIDSDGVFSGYYGIYRFGEIPVETMAELVIRVHGATYKESVDDDLLQRAEPYTLKGRALRLIPHECALLAYSVLGRIHVVQATMHHLEKTGRLTSLDQGYLQRKAIENRLPPDLLVRLTSSPQVGP